MTKDYYNILGVPNNASKEKIKKSYHILAHQYHPDKNDGKDQRFKEINGAYRVLSDDKSRIEYDKILAESNANVIKKESAPPSREKRKLPIKSIGKILLGILAVLLFFAIVNNKNKRRK